MLASLFQICLHNIIAYIMSFGSHQYQHRFFRNQPHKKLVGYTPVPNRLLPTPTYTPFYTPQPPRKPVENQLNLRVRAGEMGYNQPGWQGYRLKSYVTEKYGQNYSNYRQDQQTIERFRRQAQEHKRRLRFGNRYAHPQPNQSFLPEIRMKTEPQMQSRYSPEQELPLVDQNPEIPQVDRFDVGIMARVQSRQQEKQKEKKHSSIDIDRYQHQRRQRHKLREYRKKYSKLKARLKEELDLQRSEERVQEDEKERRKMSRIEKLMGDVADRMAKNAIIFNEGIRVEKELREMRDKSRSPSPVQQSRLTSLKQVQPQQVEAYYQEVASQQPFSKPSSPRVVYTHKRLNESYQQLQHLKSEIRGLNQRIEQKYRQL